MVQRSHSLKITGVKTVQGTQEKEVFSNLVSRKLRQKVKVLRVYLFVQDNGIIYHVSYSKLFEFCNRECHRT